MQPSYRIAADNPDRLLAVVAYFIAALAPTMEIANTAVPAYVGEQSPDSFVNHRQLDSTDLVLERCARTALLWSLPRPPSGVTCQRRPSDLAVAWFAQ